MQNLFRSFYGLRLSSMDMYWMNNEQGTQKKLQKLYHLKVYQSKNARKNIPALLLHVMEALCSFNNETFNEF